MSKQAFIEEFDDDTEFDIPVAPVRSFPNPTLTPASSLQPNSPAISSPAFAPPPNPSTGQQSVIGPDGVQYVQDDSHFKSWTCVYPCYFDKNRSHKEGRRVNKELAVENPLAKDLADALKSIGFSCVLEPQKTHPQDWANPGRVRLQFKESDGSFAHPIVKNKADLYIAISHYLKHNPTTPQSALRLPIPGLPSDKPPPPPAVPKGKHWKINTVVPLHSPALTGGGVSENPLGDMQSMMRNMGGPGGMSGMGGAGGMPDMSSLMKMMGNMGGMGGLGGGMEGGAPAGGSLPKPKAKVIRGRR
ncbi:signal recognition particle subunit [Saitoella coloradoensis]